MSTVQSADNHPAPFAYEFREKIVMPDPSEYAVTLSFRERGGVEQRVREPLAVGTVFERSGERWQVVREMTDADRANVGEGTDESWFVVTRAAAQGDE